MRQDSDEEKTGCDAGEAALCIREGKERILEEWLETMRLEFEEAEAMPEFALRDDVPSIIELAAEVLEVGDIHRAGVFEPARLHGEQRAQLTESSVDMVLREIRLLRSVIVAHLERAAGKLSSADLFLIYAVFERVSDISVAAYIDCYLEREENSRREVEQNVERLRELTRMLEEERERREIFVSSIVHDLRTPLSSLQIAADFLSSFADRPELREKALARLHRNIEHLSAMAQRLLDVNRITAGQRLPLELDEVELVELIRMLVEDIHLGDRLEEHRNAREGERIRLVCSQSAIEGWWNAEAITRMITNLVENAFKYGVPPVTVTLSQEEDEVALRVHNDGDPIPAEGHERIFERFVRLETNSQLRENGWGIGLTLTRGLAQALGGHVELRSSAAEGTTFTVRLPLDSRPFQSDFLPDELQRK